MCGFGVFLFPFLYLETILFEMAPSLVGLHDEVMQVGLRRLAAILPAVGLAVPAALASRLHILAGLRASVLPVPQTP